jgi:hypothetical protein
MMALMDGTEGGNWNSAQSVVTDYTSDDAAVADLMAGFINLGMVLVSEIKALTDESDEDVLLKTSRVIAAVGDAG